MFYFFKLLLLHPESRSFVLSLMFISHFGQLPSDLSVRIFANDEIGERPFKAFYYILQEDELRVATDTIGDAGYVPSHN